MRRLLVVALLLAAACSSDGAQGRTTSTTEASITGTVTIFAASSLKGAIDVLAGYFENDHPGVTVDAIYESSSRLSQQLIDGAEADLFASADEANADKVIAADLVQGKPAILVRNRLQIAVPTGNAAGIRSLADMTELGLKVALCAPAAPCGAYAAEAFEKAGLAVPAASQEENVKAVLAKVQQDEVDAGIVYVTDVLSGGPGVEGVVIPDDVNVLAAYPIVALRSSQNAAAAAAFQDFLLSDEGKVQFQADGFLAP